MIAMPGFVSTEAQDDRPRLNFLPYIRRLREWKVSETYEMVEHMLEMRHTRSGELWRGVAKAQQGVKEMARLAVNGLAALEGLEEELARVRSPLTSGLAQEQEQELIQYLGLEQVWVQTKREQWEQLRRERDQLARERWKRVQQEGQERWERHRQRQPQEYQWQWGQQWEGKPYDWEWHQEQEEQRQRVQQQDWEQEERHEREQWEQWEVYLGHQMPGLGARVAVLEPGCWAQEVVLGPVQARLQELGLGPLQMRLQQERYRLQGTRRETLGRLLQSMEVRQAQLMEPWRRCKELQEEEHVLQEEEQELGRVLPRMRMASAHLFRLLRQPLGRLPGMRMDQLSQMSQGNPDWREVDRVVAWRGTRDWAALDKGQVEAVRGRLRRTAIQGQEPLIDVILGNHSKFITQSPYLDALLVFAGLFSAILSAFLIDIRKGLQEDLLLEILHQLQRAPQPFQPTLVSVWVNGLWFTSLAASLIGVLVVMLAKSLGRWTIEEKHARAIFSKPEQLQRRYREIKRIYMHAIFAWELSFLTGTASTFIFTAVVLFFAGLAVLLYTTQTSIGISFLGITSATLSMEISISPAGIEFVTLGFLRIVLYAS